VVEFVLIFFVWLVVVARWMLGGRGLEGPDHSAPSTRRRSP